MKKILFILLISLFGCVNTTPNVKRVQTEFKIMEFYGPLYIVEVDKCEYLFGEWGNATVFTHKGNCKFCAERSKINVK
jgi:hypothetical protein